MYSLGTVGYSQFSLTRNVNRTHTSQLLIGILRRECKQGVLKLVKNISRLDS